VARTIRVIARTIRRDVGAARAHPRRMTRSNEPTDSAPVDLHVAQHEGLVQVHRALSAALSEVASTPADAPADQLVPKALGAGRFLLGHHHVESAVLFPGLRRLGRLRTSDVAVLDACDREHRELHALCERPLASASAPHPVVGEIVLVARDLEASFMDHIAGEEAGLAPEQLRAMIDRRGLEEIGRELEALRRQYTP
jgi:hypothetical protein